MRHLSTVCIDSLTLYQRGRFLLHCRQRQCHGQRAGCAVESPSCGQSAAGVDPGGREMHLAGSAVAGQAVHQAAAATGLHPAASAALRDTQRLQVYTLQPALQQAT